MKTNLKNVDFLLRNFQEVHNEQILQAERDSNSNRSIFTKKAKIG